VIERKYELREWNLPFGFISMPPSQKKQQGLSVVTMCEVMCRFFLLRAWAMATLLQPYEVPLVYYDMSTPLTLEDTLQYVFTLSYSLDNFVIFFSSLPPSLISLLSVLYNNYHKLLIQSFLKLILN
jgi:hypothetical protein